MKDFKHIVILKNVLLSLLLLPRLPLGIPLKIETVIETIMQNTQNSWNSDGIFEGLSPC